MDIAVRLQMLDQLSQPAARATEAMNRLRGAVRSIDSAPIDRTTRALTSMTAMADRASAKMAALRSQAMRLGVGALAIGGPLAVGAGYERELTRFGQVMGWTASNMGENIAKINRVLVTASHATRQSTSDLLASMQQIVSIAGNVFEGSDGALDLNKLQHVATVIGRTATATGAALGDLNNTTAVLLKNVGLSYDKLEQAFDIIAQAGKLGGFELKDAARWFPSLLTSYSQLYDKYLKNMPDLHPGESAQQFRDRWVLGMVGNLSAYLQYARLGAADPNIAANNLVNVLQKMFLKETSKNFLDEMGIDFRKVLASAADGGKDAIDTILQVTSKYIDTKGGNVLFTGELFADRQALEGLLSLLRVFRQRRGEMNLFMDTIRSARGVIAKDFMTATDLLVFRWAGLMNIMTAFSQQLVFSGGGSVVGEMLDRVTDSLYHLIQLMQSNPDITKYAVSGGLTVAGIIGGLILMRYAVAALSLGFARAGMGAIGMLRLLPGLVPILGMVGGMLGPIAKIGLFAHGGVLAYANWDKIAPLFGGFGQRLQETFPQAFAWVTEVGLPKLHSWLGLTRAAAASLAGELGRIGRPAFDALNYLFTGAGSAVSATTAKEGILGLAGSLRESTPGLQKLQGWWTEYRRELTFQEGWRTGLSTWLKTIGVGFGVFSAWAIGTHGTAGFLIALAALRSMIFVIGMAVAALNVLATAASMILAPVLETILESRWARALMAGFGRAMLAGGAALSVAFYNFGWEGTKNLLAGMADRFSATTAASWSNLKEQWSALWTTLFGVETDVELAARLERWKEFGTIAGDWVAWGLQKIADAIEQLTNSIQRFKVTHPGAFDFVTGWSGTLLAVTAGIAVFASLARMVWAVVRGLYVLSGLRAAVGLATGAYGVGAAAVGAAGGWASRGWIAGRLAHLGWPGLALAATLGLGAAYNRWRPADGSLYDAATGEFMPDKHWTRAQIPGMSPNDIIDTGKDVASGIRDGGNAIVGALNSVAQAIYNAIGSMGAGGGVAARSRGALSDGGYAGGSGGYGP